MKELDASATIHGGKIAVPVRAGAFQLLFRLAPNRLMVWLTRWPLPFQVAEFVIVGRRTATAYRYPLTVLQVDGSWYVGHPNGRSQWVQNLAAAGIAVVNRRRSSTTVRATELANGRERDRAIRATSQQPFPANLVYRAGRAHVAAQGAYFRLEPIVRDELDT